LGASVDTNACLSSSLGRVTKAKRNGSLIASIQKNRTSENQYFPYILIFMLGRANAQININSAYSIKAAYSIKTAYLVVYQEDKL